MVQPTCSASAECQCLCDALFPPHISTQANMNGCNDSTSVLTQIERQLTPKPMRAPPLQNKIQSKEQTLLFGTGHITQLLPDTILENWTEICLHPRLF